MKVTESSVKRILVGIVVVGIAGCVPSQKSELSAGRTRLTVDFQKDQALRYRFSTSRDIQVDWGQAEGKNVGKTKSDKTTESLELIVSYTPVEIDPYGLTTIKALCESAKVTRSGGPARQRPGPDAAESFKGKTWTFTVESTGKMEDRTQLLEVIREAGKLAFRADKSQGLIKEPDMIYDFIATQWFLWDSVSSISKPAAGVAPGRQWKSKLFVPAPMILFSARDVNYKLEEIQQGEKGKIAVIGSTYSLFYPAPSDWPVPYTELFQMSGMFGFLRGFKTLDLQGQGQELFNIDAGRTEKYSHKYTMHIAASLPMGLGLNPQITIDQTITMDILEPKK